MVQHIINYIRTCYALHQCYKCLEHDGCDHQNTGYLLNAYIDGNGERQIDCGNVKL